MYQEEIIYEDSPLADYFNSIDEDFEFTNINTENEKGKKKINFFIKNYEKCLKHFKNVLQHIYEKLLLDNLLLLDMEEISTLLEPFLNYLSKTITKSQYENLMKEKSSFMLFKDLNAFSKSVSINKKKKAFLPKDILLPVLFILFIQKFKNHMSTTLSENVNTILYISMAIAFLFNMKSQINKYYQYTVINNIIQFANEYVKLDNVANKCIRHIQEVELVSRGYKLSNNIAPINRLELSMPKEELQCLHLREMVLETIKIINIEENTHILALREVYKNNYSILQQILKQFTSFDLDEEYINENNNNNNNNNNSNNKDDFSSNSLIKMNQYTLSSSLSYHPDQKSKENLNLSLLMNDILYKQQQKDNNYNSSIIYIQYNLFKRYYQYKYHLFKNFIEKEIIDKRLKFLKWNNKKFKTTEKEKINLLNKLLNNQPFSKNLNNNDNNTNNTNTNDNNKNNNDDDNTNDNNKNKNNNNNNKYNNEIESKISNYESTSLNIPLESKSNYQTINEIDNTTNSNFKNEIQYQNQIKTSNHFAEKFKSLNDLLAKKYDPSSTEEIEQIEEEEKNEEKIKEKEKEEIMVVNEIEQIEKNEFQNNENKLFNNNINENHHINNDNDNDNSNDNEIISSISNINSIGIQNYSQENNILSTEDEIRKDIYQEEENQRQDQNQNQEEIEGGRVIMSFKNLALQLDSLLAKGELMNKNNNNDQPDYSYLSSINHELEEESDINNNTINQNKNKNNNEDDDTTTTTSTSNSNSNIKKEESKSENESKNENENEKEEENKEEMKEEENEKEKENKEEMKEEENEKEEENKEEEMKEEENKNEKEEENKEENKEEMKEEGKKVNLNNIEENKIITNNKELEISNSDIQGSIDIDKTFDINSEINNNSNNNEDDYYEYNNNNNEYIINDSDNEQYIEDQLIEINHDDVSQFSSNNLIQNESSGKKQNNLDEEEEFFISLNDNYENNIDNNHQYNQYKIININNDNDNDYKKKKKNKKKNKKNNHENENVNNLANELALAFSKSNNFNEIEKEEEDNQYLDNTDNELTFGFSGKDFYGDDQAYINSLNFSKSNPLLDDIYNQAMMMKKTNENDKDNNNNNNNNIVNNKDKEEKEKEKEKGKEKEKEQVNINNDNSNKLNFEVHPNESLTLSEKKNNNIVSNVNNNQNNELLTATISEIIPLSNQTIMTKREQLMLDYLKSQLNQCREYCYNFVVFLLISYQFHPLNKSFEINYWLNLNDSLNPWINQIHQWYQRLEGQLSNNNIINLSSIEENDKEKIQTIDKDSRILCQKLKYMNVAMQEIQIQLSFFYDEFVQHASSPISTHNYLNNNKNEKEKENEENEEALILLEQEDKIKMELNKKYEQMLKNIEHLQKEFNEARYVMDAIFNQDKEALNTLRERQYQLNYQKKLELQKQKQKQSKKENQDDTYHDPSIRLFEESTIIEMDSEERVYEAIVGADEKEEKRPHSKLTRTERIIIQKQKREEERKKREKLNQTLNMISELKNVLTEREKVIKENVRQQIKMKMPQ
ncbi:hypothetical protein BCR32DRAFT_293408 [Anaeromyces robustus]|uniref:Uncharacterized protein n=1 Tax=Anaeromyces robustus TaxID=1754192 RepID=A0A1Y1X790_9FUNG|nr:hypothetical protein BCR32DRAFT_293408 [Anaeromyces robustus]|eukprot:ORX81204.1 hypothetical protein BCR32DRAFT_293408 [Anaeromyces robustus]